jgi:competence protein ComEA
LRIARGLRAAGARLCELLLPAEGEAWLVGLFVVLLLLGALRHRLEPWITGVAEPPPAVLAAAEHIDPARFGRVDLNRATAAELASLPRIGPALAARIVADRSAHGPFTTLADLDRVRGVGPGILAAIRDEITVGPAAGDTILAE